MALGAGTRIGPYEIVAPLGAGGMGEVYRAHDSRLGREVAIKVLPPSFAADADRLRRFEQEARVVAALNHPNILAVYDTGTHDGAPYLVSELLEGSTLREKLDAGPLPSRKATDISHQVALGLAAAHAKGITHRDLKPENIFLTRDGRAKILDFGLAKQKIAEHAAATMTGSATAAGVVMGTIGYMAPEQVRGEAADHRSDIFAFGAILYEMLCGQRAFRRESGPETMTAILKEDPPEMETAKAAPGLERIVRRCLEKDPEQRFHSASDLAFAIEALSGTTGTQTHRVVAPPPHRRLLLPIALAAVVLAAVAGYLAWPRLPNNRITLARITFQRGNVYSARFTPDGRSVIYSASWEGRPFEIYSTREGAQVSTALGVQGSVAGIADDGEMALIINLHRVNTWMQWGTLATMPLGGSAPRELLDNVFDADISSDGKQFAVVRPSGSRQQLEYPIGHVLYSTDGYVSDPRIVPGVGVAFLDHPVYGDDRGRIAVVDSAGNVKRLSREFAGLHGFLWNPRTRELWFGGSVATEPRGLWAVDLNGHERLVWRIPVDMTLYGVAANGDVLLSRELMVGEAYAVFAGKPPSTDLSPLGWSNEGMLSADGQTIFLTESGEGAGADYEVEMRKVDGSPAVHLGSGTLMAVSNHGKWVLSQLPSRPDTLQLLPTGAGESRQMSTGGLVINAFAGQSSFSSDDTAVYFVAAEPSHAPRTYRMLFDGSAPQPVTSEGYAGGLLSSDGTELLVTDPKGSYGAWSLANRQFAPLRGFETGDHALAWDGDFIYVLTGNAYPATISRVSVSSGRREEWQTVRPYDTAGLISLPRGCVAPRAQAYCYQPFRDLSDLYLVKGLR